MKKLLAILLAGVMVFGLMACSAPKEETPADEADTGTETTADTTETSSERVGDVNGDGKFIVGYISKNTTDTFHGPINARAIEVLDGLKADGTIDDWTGILDGQTDPGVQINLADDCVTKGCDAVIILPAEAEGSAPAVATLAENGIAVVVVNSKTNNTDELAVAYSGSDDVYAGTLLAQHVVDNVPDGGKYVHIQGVLGNSAQIQRGEGIEQIMKDHPEFEKVEEMTGNWNSSEAQNIAQDALSKYGKDLVAIICDNDDMSSGAQDVVNAAGRSDIVCVGVDGNNYPLSLVKDGKMLATVLQDGVGQIEAGIGVVKAIATGESYEKNIDVPFVLVTKDNVDQYYTGE
ncbi:MAG: substrate-binding domain-containing protein [Lachnospiraceae bacterium]|jgi:ABC-type sugar transport system substrate-binding protein|nr:substrate-binding domain-containing protein [Lachnospiraceae bacterium]